MKDRKVYCLNNISHMGLDKFRDGYEIIDEIDEAAAVIVRSADMHDMEFPKTLRAIGRAGAGVNNIPVDECAKHGIVVFNAPGANANSVKELVVAALMLVSRDIEGGMNWVRENAINDDIKKLAEKAKKQFAGNEIKGRALGVIGLGAIGVEVANIAAELGMEVYGYDPYMSLNSAWHLTRKAHICENIEDIYKNADFITLHVPANESTKGIISNESIDKMKDGVKILNFARAALINEEDMDIALENGKVAAFITDFPTDKTVKMKNTTVFPHLGASTKEAEDNSAIMAVEEVQDYLDNGNIRNSVNFPTIDAGVCTSISRIAVLHENVPKMLGMITKAMGDADINIDNLLNKSAKDYAYTLMDLGSHPNAEAFENLKKIKGVVRVRRVK